MTFTKPTEAGVLVPLEGGIKSAITGNGKDTAGKYLIYDGSLRIRNNVGFHAALAELADGLFERIVIPYQTNVTLGDLSSLVGATFGNGTNGSLMNLFQDEIIEQLAAPEARSHGLKIATSRRYCSFRAWKNILTQIFRIKHTPTVEEMGVVATISCPLDGSSHDISVYPPSPKPSDFNSEALDVPSPTYWMSLYESSADWPFWNPAYKYLACMCEIRDDYRWTYWYLHTSIMDLLWGLAMQAAGVSYTYTSGQSQTPIGGFLYEVLRGKWSSIVKRKSPWFIKTAQGSAKEKPIENLLDLMVNWEYGGSAARGPLVTARPNLDVLALYQMYLGMVWANWAKVVLAIKRKHESKTLTVEWTVNSDGVVSKEEEPERTDSFNKVNEAYWGRSVSYEKNGEEWSNGGQTFRGGYTLDVDEALLRRLEVEKSTVDEYCQEAAEEVDMKETAASTALAILDDVLSSAATRAIFDNEFDNVVPTPSAPDEYDRYSLHVQGGLLPSQQVSYGSTSPSKDVWWGDVVACVKAWVMSAGVDGNDFNGSGPEAVAQLYSPPSLIDGYFANTNAAIGQAAIDAAQAMKELRDAKRALDDGYSQDITGILSDVASYATPEWDGREPRKPSPGDEISVTAVTSVSYPLFGSTNTSVYFAGVESMTSLPWPAQCVVDGGYVASETACIGYALEDTLKDYRIVGSRYVQGRSPSEAKWGILDKQSVSANITQDTPRSLALTIADRVETRSNQLNKSPGWPALPLARLAIIEPTMSGAEESSEKPYDVESLNGCGGPYYACYRCDDGSSSPPAPGGEKVRPYKIMDKNGAVVWQEGDSNINICFEYHDDAHGPSASFPDGVAEEMTIHNSAHMALRVEWKWKSMPVEP